MTPAKDYPIGMQDFAEIVQNNYLYVDKTDFIYKIAHSKKFYFLSRPRRFGKTLFLSSLEYFFLGRRDLFKGLKIAELEKDWIEYPVLHFDLSTIEASSTQSLKNDLDDKLTQYEAAYDIKYEMASNRKPSLGQRFGNLIRKLNLITGKGVVILIDEYDKGILDVLQNEKRLEKNRTVLRNFFTQIKANDKYIRFAMLTGVSRFRHLTIFSGINNLVDLSMDPQFSSICGITIDELYTYFDAGMGEMCTARNCTQSELIDDLKQKYDGYRFSSANSHVFNPYSLLSVFNRKEMANFWIMSGTSKVFVDFLSKAHFSIDELISHKYNEETLASAFDSTQPVPLLYQTGYLSILDCKDGIFTLTVPNGEVRQTLMEQIMPLYMGVKEGDTVTKLYTLKEMIMSGDVDGWLKELKALMASAPYQLLTKDEEHPVERFYHLMIYQMFIMLGISAQSEISVAGGRIDMVAKTNKFIYVMEFKLDGTPASALKQINDSGYAIPYSVDGRSLYKIGISFSSKTHTIEKWKIEK